MNEAGRPVCGVEDHLRIAQAVDEAIAPLGTGFGALVEELVRQVQLVSANLGLVVMRLESNRLALASRPSGNVWLNFVELTERVLRRQRLPDMYFIVNAHDATRVISPLLDATDAVADATGPLSADARLGQEPGALEWFVVPTAELTARWLVGATGRAAAAGKHPSFFSPFPWPLLFRQVPVFSLAKIPSVHADLLYPGAHVYRVVPKNSRDAIPWSDKKAALYWRGATTGGVVRLDNYLRFPRVRLALAASEIATADIGLTEVAQAVSTDERKMVTQALDELGVMMPRDPMARQFEYKYVFDIDGNVSAFRLSRGLLSGSVIFKGPNLYEEWYGQWLERGVHYVESSPHFNDLAEKIEWARANDARLHNIAQNATAFAERYFTWTMAEAYMEALLVAYAERYHG